METEKKKALFILCYSTILFKKHISSQCLFKDSKINFKIKNTAKLNLKNPNKPKNEEWQQVMTGRAPRTIPLTCVCHLEGVSATQSQWGRDNLHVSPQARSTGA